MGYCTLRTFFRLFFYTIVHGKSHSIVSLWKIRMLKKRVRLLDRNYVSYYWPACSLTDSGGSPFDPALGFGYQRVKCIGSRFESFRNPGEKQTRKVLSICCLCARPALSGHREWKIREWNAFPNRCQFVCSYRSCKVLSKCTDLAAFQMLLKIWVERK